MMYSLLYAEPPAGFRSMAASSTGRARLFQIGVKAADGCQPEQIINIRMVQLCKRNQNSRRDIALSEFIIAVNLLRAMQIFRNIPLLHIGILA